MEQILDFLRALRANNSRQWFGEHKADYEKAKAGFEAIATQFLSDICSFDPTVRHLTLKDCVYRFYRDIRFSKDKSPYKTHFGVYVCMGGKKSCRAGYYLHLEPVWEDHSGGSALYCGSFMPDKDNLRLIREDIYNNGKEYNRLILSSKKFKLDTSEKLTRNPKDFPPCPFDDLLRLKSFLLVQTLGENLLSKPQKDLLFYLKGQCKESFDFVKQLNEAMSFEGNY